MSDSDKHPESKPDPTAHLDQYKWKPGQSGNPKGRPKKRLISDALRAKLEVELGEGETLADLIASRIVDMIKSEDDPKAFTQLFKEIVDRTEGRPAQKIEVNPNDDGNFEIVLSGKPTEIVTRQPDEDEKTPDTPNGSDPGPADGNDL